MDHCGVNDAVLCLVMLATMILKRTLILHDALSIYMNSGRYISNIFNIPYPVADERLTNNHTASIVQIQYKSSPDVNHVAGKEHTAQEDALE